jgi:hypothetical protein
MKKIICFILILSLTLSIATPIVSADTTLQQAVTNIKATITRLTDLIVNGIPHWAKPYIDKLTEIGIIAGYPDGTFRPNNNVEVDAYIKMVVCGLGNKLDNGKDYWASPYIEKAIELKLIDTNEFNTYRRIITREEAAKVIVNALATKEQLPSEEEINKYITKVPDYLKIADKYKKHVLYAYAIGMITGDSKGNFNPKNNLTRAEAATIIMKLLDKSLRKPISLEAISIILPELLESDEEVWGRKDIYDFTSYGYYTIKDGNILFQEPPTLNDYELNTDLNPDIREQVYKATKVLMDDSHYVDTKYANFGKTKAFVSVAKSSVYASNFNYLFEFMFYEKETYNAKRDWNDNNFSEKIYLTLDLGRLWRDFDKNSWSTSFYETKLKHTLMAIFGESEGQQIYDYVYGIYIDKRKNPDKYLNKNFTKSFTTVKIDFPNDDSSMLYFLFSKVGD